MPQDTHETFSSWCARPFGMVLCAGPTGSGKTTTLYATMSEINESQRNIMTIEDPVEYVFPSINQISTNEQAGLTFATGLKSILRQDPDVILVGEIRDVDTARIATQSALTGHFVLSSLHATDAVAGPAPLPRHGHRELPHRLVRRRRRRPAPHAPQLQELQEGLQAHRRGDRVLGGERRPPEGEVLHGRRLQPVQRHRLLDRVGVYELLTVTPEIKRLVVGWATQDELRRMAIKQGMRTMRDEAVDLVANDQTTIQEVVRNIYTG
jgi:type IV pilus assembly protein PilB